MATHQVHIINHTHWDREWFLTAEYTSRWIPDLLRRLEQRAAHNPSFRYLLDGQTLVVEDLLNTAPDLEPLLRRLVKGQHLAIGPYYAQPDWQLTSGELLVRNLQLGLQDARRFGGAVSAGWMVDTFGHISQSPQIHRMFGLQALFVWRGVPRLEPYFTWQGPDGSTLLTINLFGGYRNLYGVTHVPEVAVRRLEAEAARLAPFYPTPDIPLFDGYDLEDNPEDPLTFYAQLQADGRGPGPELTLQESTPSSFAWLIAGMGLSLPVLQGELNSGKYGATFPGVFSTRTYLKIMASDCQDLQHRRCEPLAALAAQCGQPYPAHRFEKIDRLLLQNGVHDCICGVSIDQVHEKMAISYHQAFEELLDILRESLAHILQGFAPGTYAVSTSPFAGESWLTAGEHLLYMKTGGLGFWPVIGSIPLAPPPDETAAGPFSFSNDHYQASLAADGLVHIGPAVLGELRVYREEGDTYSDERGELLGILRPVQPPQVIECSARHAVLAFDCEWRGADAWISARVRLTFDPSPLVRWQIDLDSSGTDFSIDVCFDTARSGGVWAGMPFDLVQRPEVDTDLLPRQPAPELASILLGQRELGEVRTFPFHNFVAVSNPLGSSVVFARGLHAYQARASTLAVTLQRSVEWLTRADLAGRVGDAGPFFYVPDARSERIIHHELAFAALPVPAVDMQVQALNAAFQDPPLVVQVGGRGTHTHWSVLQENLPLSSLQLLDGALVARLYNPTNQAVRLSKPWPAVDVWGRALPQVSLVPPKAIVNLRVEIQPQDRPGADVDASGGMKVINLPGWRVGPSHGAPDPAVLALLAEKIARLDADLVLLDTELDRLDASPAGTAARLRLEHRQAALQRERLEYRLSLLLNQRKLDAGGSTPAEALYQADPEIAALGKALNDLRIKRRIYDYVVQALD